MHTRVRLCGGPRRRRGRGLRCVPEDGDGLAGELERDSALDGRRDAVASLAAIEDLLRVLYRDLDTASITWI